MRRHWRKLRGVLAAVAVTLVGTGVVVALLPEPPGISKANFRRIQPGMSRAEVETLLAGPERRECDDWGVGVCFDWWESNPGQGHLVHRWTGPSGGIDVGFDASGKVNAAWWLIPADKFVGLDSLRIFVQLCRERWFR